MIVGGGDLCGGVARICGDPVRLGVALWRAFHALGLATFSTAAASFACDLAPPPRRGSTMGAFGLASGGCLTIGPGVGLACPDDPGLPRTIRRRGVHGARGSGMRPRGAGRATYYRASSSTRLFPRQQLRITF